MNDNPNVHAAPGAVPNAANVQAENAGPDVDRDSRIRVNGRQRTVEGREVGFEEVVKLAFPSGPTKPNTKFTVTYRHAAQVPHMAELDPGQKVKVKPGRDRDDETVFNVTETVLS